MRKAAWNAHERKRLYHEAVEFLRLRAERWKYARQASSRTRAVAVPIADSRSRPESGN